ncbi:NmrA family NAD(P)-binding protein [Paenibacillus sp. Y412MC10]|uniref:NmrA family NAD(P)-binding protein n=1 Tax=Geobacillus sp. (strain Y412MC10) TaxID=481743 RepID=UPI0011A817E0|nr:NmrA family NAD(P)-binding protein [Paenibacillus sp. Y412MC10]
MGYGKFSPAGGAIYVLLKKEQIYTVLNAETHLDMVAAEDVGAFGRAALEDPIGFNGKNIDLAGDSITMNEVAFHLSHFLGKKIKSVSLLPSEAC